jgi:hypothetical protein
VGREAGREALDVYFSRVDPPHTLSDGSSDTWVYEEGGEVRARSKWTMLLRGAVCMGDYDDVLARTPSGSRIRHRTPTARMAPPPVRPQDSTDKRRPHRLLSRES